MFAETAAGSVMATITGSGPSPVPSEIFALVSLLAIAVVVVLILRFYLPLRTTPAYLLVPVFFALLLPACMVLLVPIDLASSAKTDDVDARGIWLEPRPLLVSWRIVYWLTFALTWFILPILAEYSDSGYREPKAKVLDSLRANAQYYAAVFGSGLLGLVYVLVYYGHFSESLKSTAMALAYCWGLVLAIYLMGHGLVALPRRLFRDASLGGRLRRLQSRAPALHERMEDAELDLEDLEARVAELARRKTAGSARDFRDWIEELVDLVSLPEAALSSSMSSSSSSARGRSSLFRNDDDDLDARARHQKLPTVITEKYMADLTRRLVRARHARARYAGEWISLLQQAVDTQAVLDSAASKKLEPAAPPHETAGSLSSSSTSSSMPVVPSATSASSSWRGWWILPPIFTPYTRYLFRYHAVPALRIFAGAILSAASVCIVWSELVKGVFPAASVIRYSVVHHWAGGEKGQVGLAGQAVAVFWMLYMCAAALASVTEVRVWRGRALVRRNTAHESAFWYAGLVARLSIPLSYNFMTLVGVQTYRNTVFYDFLGRLIDLTPLGKWFDYLFPAFVLVPVCAALFGLYGRVQRLFGLGVVDMADDDEDEEEGAGGPGSNATAAAAGRRRRTNYDTAAWRRGRDLIERELNGTSAALRGRRAEAAARLASEQHGASGGGGRRTAPVLTVPGGGQRPTSPLLGGAASSPHHANLAAVVGVGARPQANTSARRVGAPSTRGSGRRAALDEEENEGEEDDENFFGTLGHRFRNTIDTLETPRWLQEIGQGIKRPKWMGSGNDNNNRSSSDNNGNVGIGDGGSGSRARGHERSGSSDIRRWFGGGGGGGEGRIRL